jgi:Apoptosis inhibitory protein 5 (API5)
MNKEDEDRQIRETRSLLQKAGQRNAPLDTVRTVWYSIHRSCPQFYVELQRRDALRRLIGLAHTPSRELKVFAAQNFSHYFKDFPDLEEDVIDSVYDICEDPDAQVIREYHSRDTAFIPCLVFQVRIEGYKAIVSLSSESRKWTRRNTDVLVQLLQSGVYE